ncbi:MAG: DEAD/DEAH box helicase, partial [Flavobacteriaceae bacterium]|nr:DEAD/DEAH box helicase [Flavobacteriaceae bacterium]
KTFAYLLPILSSLSFSEQENPRILIMVPTRELVVQLVDEIKKLTPYVDIRVQGVYGGTNINTQKKALAEGLDILVATPGRLYDLAVSRVLKLKSIKNLVIDEVDIMLDLGFRHQLLNIFDVLPMKRQNIMFSATMTEDADALISDFFKNPKRLFIAPSGTPLKNIEQQGFKVPNYYTRVNLLEHLLRDTESYNKAIIFVSFKKIADRLFESLAEFFPEECCVIHSNKTQNYRLRSVRAFDTGEKRILIATDVMARGLDFDEISHVINFDTPLYPENYIHRIGRTGRAKKQGKSLVFTTLKEEDALLNIEILMGLEIQQNPFPEAVEISKLLAFEEIPVIRERENPHKRIQDDEPGPSFHEKKEKNLKENLGGSYRREIAKKYKKPKTRGDKNYNRRDKRR